MKSSIPVEEVIFKDGIVIFAPTGQSMQPNIFAQKDKVVIKKREKHSKCKRMDVILFRRTDGTYVLHRVIKVFRDKYWVVGDNCTWGEYVYDDQILGVLIKIIRGNSTINVSNRYYLFKIYNWYIIWTFRYVINSIKTRIHYLFAKK